MIFLRHERSNLNGKIKQFTHKEFEIDAPDDPAYETAKHTMLRTIVDGNVTALEREKRALLHVYRVLASLLATWNLLPSDAPDSQTRADWDIDSALAFFDDRTNVSVEFVAHVQMGMLVHLKAIEWNVRPNDCVSL